MSTPFSDTATILVASTVSTIVLILTRTLFGRLNKLGVGDYIAWWFLLFVGIILLMLMI